MRKVFKIFFFNLQINQSGQHGENLEVIMFFKSTVAQHFSCIWIISINSESFCKYFGLGKKHYLLQNTFVNVKLQQNAVKFKYTLTISDNIIAYIYVHSKHAYTFLLFPLGTFMHFCLSLSLSLSFHIMDRFSFWHCTDRGTNLQSSYNHSSLGFKICETALVIIYYYQQIDSCLKGCCFIGIFCLGRWNISISIWYKSNSHLDYTQVKPHLFRLIKI